jgi:hypothetical protein
MPFKNILRKILLCFALGGHSVFGLGMSQEKIEELLHAMNQTRVEVTIADGDEPSDPKKSPGDTMNENKIEEAVTNES